MSRLRCIVTSRLAQHQPRGEEPKRRSEPLPTIVLAAAQSEHATPYDASRA